MPVRAVLWDADGVLQHLPADKVPQCGPDLYFMLENFPLSRTLQFRDANGTASTLELSVPVAMRPRAPSRSSSVAVPFFIWRSKLARICHRWAVIRAWGN